MVHYRLRLASSLANNGLQMNNQGLEILIVEDDEDDYYLLQSCLSQVSNFHYSLVWAPSFYEAIDQLNHHSPDLMLVDYVLGCYSGLELVKGAKAAGRDIPSVLVTSRELEDIGGENTIYSYFNGYINKANLTAQKLEEELDCILPHR